MVANQTKLKSSKAGTLDSFDMDDGREKSRKVEQPLAGATFISFVSTVFFASAGKVPCEGTKSHRGRNVGIVAVLLVGIVAYVAMLVPGDVSTKTFSSSSSSDPKASKFKRGHSCVKGEIEDLNFVTIDFDLEGLAISLDSKQESVVELAVIAAYNQVSAGCEDLYERWMHEATVIRQTVEQGKVVVSIQMTISCHDCPPGEAFASDFEEPTTTLGLSNNFLYTATTIEAAVVKRIRVRGQEALPLDFGQETLPFAEPRKLHGAIDDFTTATINAMDVFASFNVILKAARDNNEIERAYSGFSHANIRRVAEEAPRLLQFTRSSRGGNPGLMLTTAL